MEGMIMDLRLTGVCVSLLTLPQGFPSQRPTVTAAVTPGKVSTVSDPCEPRPSTPALSRSEAPS